MFNRYNSTERAYLPGNKLDISSREVSIGCLREIGCETPIELAHFQGVDRLNGLQGKGQLGDDRVRVERVDEAELHGVDSGRAVHVFRHACVARTV